MRTGILVLSTRDRRFLEQFRSQGEHLARELTRSHILLALADRVPVVPIQQVLGVSRMVIWRTRSAYEEKGLDYALYDVARSGQPLKYDTDQEAEVVALACSQPPEGAARWTIRLLTVTARHRPKLASINRESVRQILKKNVCKPWRKAMWCIGSSSHFETWRGDALSEVGGRKPIPKDATGLFAFCNTIVTVLLGTVPA
ncbi:MAG: helix-turn-helix domain-containing protein, partial [Verrucomicrobia bacterium]|nr:helix-turn-helix domain-containing protein [Verrucomicrobiota bacterium]